MEARELPHWSLSHRLRQLHAHLLRRGHPFRPAPAPIHPDPDRSYLSALRAASAPSLALAACACLRRAGLPVPGRRALPALLRAAARARCAATARGAHGLAVRVGVEDDGFVGTALVGAYAACGRIADARGVFDGMPERDLVAWGVMLEGCADMEMAEKLYNGMPRKDLVSSTAMVFGYAKNGKLEIARSIFNRMPEKDVVSWSAMISGYAESNQPSEALNLFNDMQECGVSPDEITMLSVISACANIGGLDKARWIHTFIENHGLCKILSVCNALIDMFSKCGSLTLALNIFNAMPRKNVITWTSMITAFAMHGDGRSALTLFEQMKSEGVEPNGVTFLGLLYACCHAGLVDEGRSLFKCMVQEYRIEPKHEHYGCMVDLLGRAKLLREAVELIESMRLRPNVAVWGSLLAACWMHGDLEIGSFAAKKILELDPNHDGAYVLLSKIHTKSGNWNDAQEVRGAMQAQGVLKETGCSRMELNDTVHEFAAGGENIGK